MMYLGGTVEPYVLLKGKAQNKPMDLRIGSGFLQFQTAEEPMPLHHEDVLVGWKISDKFPTKFATIVASMDIDSCGNSP